MTEIISTDEFWNKMSSPSFVRLSRLSGKIGIDVYVTLQAPEDVSGFIESKLFPGAPDSGWCVYDVAAASVPIIWD